MNQRSKASATLLERAKPKGFPTSSARRLQPIKATDLKNCDLAAIPPSFDNKLLNNDIMSDCGYKSYFGAKNAAR